MSYGLFTFVSSLLFFVKSGHSFFRWYALERRSKQTSQDSSFQSWLFYSLFS